MADRDLEEANPWLALPQQAPFVLPHDAPVLEAFHRYEPEPRHYQLELPPDPWQGCWDAPVLLLLQNPSHDDGDFDTYSQEAVIEANRRNMGANAGNEPMYWLADAFKDTYSGRWWRRALNRLVSDLGIDCVRSGLLVVELYGYRSRQFWPIPRTLESQRFSLRLVTEAMDRGAVIILPRASRFWEVALPELYGYPGLVRGNLKTRSPAVSPGNLQGEGYERVVAAIKAGRNR